MKKMKVENVSSMKLDFFLRQNQEDVRVVLGPGESSWCEPGSSTKSMILYERKNLIKITSEETVNDSVDINNDEALDKLHTTEDIRTVALDIVPVQPMSPPDGIIEIAKSIEINENTKLVFPVIENKFVDLSVLKTTPRNDLPHTLSPGETISETGEVIPKSTEESKKEKTYKGKKRGRKKKRGPKTGSKKNKTNQLPTMSETKSGIITTGTTEN